MLHSTTVQLRHSALLYRHYPLHRRQEQGDWQGVDASTMGLMQRLAQSNAES